MVNYDNGDTGVGLGTNFWGGYGDMSEFAQQTGFVSFRSGKFSFTYENDGAPFGGKTGDNHDRYRTAAASVGWGEASVGFNLFTGERLSSSYEENGGADAAAMSGLPKGSFISRLFHKVPATMDGGNGTKLPFNAVSEQGPQYRFGGLSLRYGNYRIGINSDRYVRHPVQDIGAHYYASPQPGFQTLSGGVAPYLQYQTKNIFTTW